MLAGVFDLKMNPLEIQWREPERFAAGDTLSFNKKLPAYIPSQGWAIQLTVSKALPQGGAQKIAQIVSVPDHTNSFHTFVVPQFLAAVQVGVYILSEEAVNAGNGGEQHQIYFNDGFIVGPNLAGGAAGQVKSRWEILLDTQFASLMEMEQNILQETDQQRNHFVMQQRDKLLERIKWTISKVKNEKDIEKARNGNPPGNVQEPIFLIG